MKAKIEIPCDISNNIVYVTFYKVLAFSNKDNEVVILHNYLNEEDANDYCVFARKNFKDLYHNFIVMSDLLWL